MDYKESLQIGKVIDQKREAKITAARKRAEIRKKLVPNEPDLTSPHTVIFVRHQSMGILKRIFPEVDKMTMVKRKFLSCFQCAFCQVFAFLLIYLLSLSKTYYSSKYFNKL